MNGHDEEAGRRKVSEMIGGIDYALFTTQGIDGGPLHARPMALRKADDNGNLWFFSKRDSRKAKELGADPQVLVTFADPKKQHFVAVTGRAEIVAERSEVAAMWSEVYRAWFPDGAKDDNVVLIRVEAERAEYWDTPTGVMTYAFGYLKAVTTGEPSRAGEVGKVEAM